MIITNFDTLNNNSVKYDSDIEDRIYYLILRKVALFETKLCCRLV